VKEAQIQSAIVDYVRLVAPECLTFAVPNASRRTEYGFASNAVPGLVKGIPDLCVLAPGSLAHFIEVKSAGGDLRKEQQAILARFASMGVNYCVARSIDDVKIALAQWRISTREAA
jgi:hypothetical protein